MRNNDFAILVVSCDAYMDVVDIFFDLLEKNMPWIKCNCYLINNMAKFHRKNVTVLNCGTELNWIGRLRKALLTIPEKYVLYFQEDYLIGSSVDEKTIYNAVQMMRDKNIWYYKIDNLPKIKKKVSYCPYLSYIPSNKRYGINLLTSIIDKDVYLSKLPEYDGDAAKVEIHFLNQVTDKYVNNIEGCVLDTRKIIDVHYGVRRGKWWPKTVKYFRKNGYNIDTKIRGVNDSKLVFKMNLMSFINHCLPTWMFRMIKRIAKKVFRISFYSNDV